MALLAFLFKIATPIIVAYKLRCGTPFRLRGIATYALVVAGALAFDAGFDLAVGEASRARYGRVVPGVVVEKLSTREADGTRYIGGDGGGDQERRRPAVTITGFRVHDTLARFVLTGSPAAWAIDYRFDCEAARPCEGRDFVSEDEWSRLRAGQTIKVRYADGDVSSSGLDDNPRWPFAAVDFAVAALFFLMAGLLRPAPGTVFRTVSLTA